MPCQKQPKPTVGCNGPGTPTACIFCSKIAPSGRGELSAVLAAKLAACKKVYSRHVKEHTGGADPQWRTQYTLSTMPKGSALTVQVAIYVNNAGTGQATAAVKGRWATMIGTVWNNKAQLSVPVYQDATWAKVNETVSRWVSFELVWVDATAGSPYEVTCNRSLTAEQYADYFDALTDAQRTSLILIWRAAKPNLQNYSTADAKWKKLEYLSDVTRDHTRHGTPHLGAWGDGDSEAIQHEFGHAIGLPDEYLTTNYWTSTDGTTWTEVADVASSAAIYNAKPFTHKSLMNNTMSRSGSTVYDRHFKLLAKDFEDFVTAALHVPGVVKPGSCTVTMKT